MIAGIDKIIVRVEKSAPSTMEVKGVVIPMTDKFPRRGEIVGLPVATTHEVSLCLGDTVLFPSADGMALDLDRIVLHLTQILEVIRDE